MVARSLFLALLLLIPSMVRAENPRLEVRPSSGTLQDSFQFSIVSEGQEQASTPYLTGGDDFKITLGGVQHSVQIVNGRTTASTTYQYILIPKREGDLETPSAEIELNGRKMKLPPLKVTVSGGQQKAPDTHGDVLLTQALDREQAYVGEQVVDTIELLHDINLVEPKFSKVAFDGFWTENFKSNERDNRLIEGRYYNIIRIRRALFPLKGPAVMDIPPRELSAAVFDARRRDPFGGLNPFDPSFFNNFFGADQYKDVTVTSNPARLTVKELPPRPTNFEDWGAKSTIVGETSVVVESDASPLRVGDSKNILVEVRSFGNINPLKELPAQNLKDVRLYPESPTIEFEEHNGRLLERKLFKISVVPTRSGTVTIPPFRLGYFNPKDGEYKVAESQPISFEVTGEGIENSGSPQIVSQTPTQDQNSPSLSQTDELRYSEPSALEKISRTFSIGFVFFVVTILLATSLLFIWAHYQRHREDPGRDTFVATKEANDTIELAVAFERGVRARITDGESLSLRELVRNRVEKHDIAFNIETFLDDLHAVNSGFEEPNDSDLERLRKKALEILNDLRRA